MWTLLPIMVAIPAAALPQADPPAPPPVATAAQSSAPIPPISEMSPSQAPVVVARANGFRVRDSIVKFIASSFRPTSLAGASLEQAELETPQQALWRLCGSDSSELYKAMHLLNGNRLPQRDAVMGSAAVGLLFPACLRVEGQSVAVLAG